MRVFTGFTPFNNFDESNEVFPFNIPNLDRQVRFEIYKEKTLNDSFFRPCGLVASALTSKQVAPLWIAIVFSETEGSLQSVKLN